jgi:hypothetical protein
MSYHMIVRRGSTWHFRRAVPTALRKIVGRHEITRSLHTSDLREAKSRAIIVGAEVDALLWRARRTLQNPESAIAAVASKIVREDADWRRGLGLFIFVINAFMLLLTSWIAQAIGLGFRVDKFFAALLGALIISVVSFILSRAVTRNL